MLDLESGKLHREFHNGPDPVISIGQVSSSSSGPEYCSSSPGGGSSGSASGGSSSRVTTIPGKSWNLVRPFSRPGKSWKTAKVMVSHEKASKVMEKDDDVLEFF